MNDFTNAPVTPAPEERVNNLVEAANVWAKALSEIKDAETAGKCEDFLTQLRAEWGAVEAQRKTDKKPHDDAAKAVQERYTPLLALLETAALMMKGLKETWLQHEKKRIAEAAKAAAEEAERTAKAAADAAAAAGTTVQSVVAVEATAKAAEKAAKTAARMAAARPMVKGELSQRSSGLVVRWSAEITDYGEALAHYMDNARIRECVQALADADVKAQKEKSDIPGVKAISKEVVA